MISVYDTYVLMKNKAENKILLFKICKMDVYVIVIPASAKFDSSGSDRRGAWQAVFCFHTEGPLKDQVAVQICVQLRVYVCARSRRNGAVEIHSLKMVVRLRQSLNS